MDHKLIIAKKEKEKEKWELNEFNRRCCEIDFNMQINYHLNSPKASVIASVSIPPVEIWLNYHDNKHHLFMRFNM